MPDATPSRPKGPVSSNRPSPHSIDAERAVLGAMLLDREIVGEIERILKPEDFFENAHQVTYRRMLEVYNESQSIQLTPLAETLQRHKELDAAGGTAYLANLMQFTLSSGAAPENARIVQEKALMRRLMAAADAIITEAAEERRPAAEQLESAERLIFEIGDKVQESRFRGIDELMDETIRELVEIIDRGGHANRLRTHMEELDRLIGGFEPTALIILAARPSIGKTAFALNLVRNIAIEEKRPVGFFSLEMGAEQLNLRLLCAEAQVSGFIAQHGHLSEQQWDRLRFKAAEMKGLPIYIDDSAAINLLQLRSRARRLKSRHPNLGLIVVDYLQLMTSPPGKRDTNRQQEVSEISRGLKGLAKELHVPVLALSQLSRNIEQRGKAGESARPMLSDLRESGAIEQDADVVMFVHREREELKKDEEGRPAADRTAPIPSEIIVGKNRNGRIGTAQMLFLPETMKFVNMLSD